MAKNFWMIMVILLVCCVGTVVGQEPPTENPTSAPVPAVTPSPAPVSHESSATNDRAPAPERNDTLLVVLLIAISLFVLALLLLLLNMMRKLTTAVPMPASPIAGKFETPAPIVDRVVALQESAEQMLQALTKNMEAISEQMKAQEQLASAKLRNIQEVEKLAKDAAQKIDSAEALKNLPILKQEVEERISKIVEVLNEIEAHRGKANEIFEKIQNMEGDARRMLRDGKLKEQLTELDQMRSEFRQTIGESQKIQQSLARKDVQASELFEKLTYLRKEIDNFSASFDLPARSAELKKLEAEGARVQNEFTKALNFANVTAAEIREIHSELKDLQEKSKGFGKKMFGGRSESSSEEKGEQMESRPENVDESLVKSGDEAMSRGDYKHALISYNKALDSNKNVSGTWDKKSLALRKLGRLDEAMAACEHALELYPTFPQALFNRACIFALLKRKEEMLMYLEHACRLNAGLKKTAKSEADLKAFANDQDFQRIIL